MAAGDEWYPIGGREHSSVKGSGAYKESERRRGQYRVIAPFFVLAIIASTIGLVWRYPSILEVAKLVVMSIWDMLCRVAITFSDFIEYVKQQRSS